MEEPTNQKITKNNNAAYEVRSTLSKHKKRKKNKLQTKSVNILNKLDQVIYKNKKKYKLASLDLISQNKNNTPITVASIYDPKDLSKTIHKEVVVLIDSGASHSMAKASLVMKYQKSFFKKSKASYKTAASTFTSKHSMELTITLDEFGRSTKIKHTFDLDESQNGIGYDMIIGRDLLNQLDLDMRFSDGTMKWEDQIVPMKNFQGTWKEDHPSTKELRLTIYVQ